MRFYFPCSNGIGCYSENGVTVALVTADGSKKVQSKPSKNKVIFANIFFLRGLQYFFCGLVAMFSVFNASYSLSNYEEGAISKAISKRLYISARYLFILVTIIFSFLLTFLVLGYFPAKASFWIIGTSANLYLRCFIIALIRVAVVYLALLAFRFIPPMQTFYRFNGACDSINLDKSLKKGHNAPKVAKPLNFVNYIVFTFLFCIFVISLVAININPWANILINMAIVLGSIGLCYEILYLFEKYAGDNVKKIGLVTSWFVSMKPKITQEEIAKVVKIESGYKLGENGDLQDGLPLSALVTEMQTKLESAGRYEKSDVDWIIATVLGKNRAEVKLVRSVSEKDYREIMSVTERRAKGEPLSSIFGFVDFYGLRIDINKKVLSPRAETEILVDEALKLIKDGKRKEVCDLCTGSGAIAIAIAKNANVKVTAIDISKPALATAESNAKKHNVKIDFVESDLFEHLKKSRKFDIIVSNPPYIESEEIDKLDDEVKKYDPRIALDGGADGLDFYRRITEQARKRLNSNGVLMFELGVGQAQAVRKILKDNGFTETRVVKDYEKKERIIYGKAN